jgi:hypothetical protein
MLKVLLPFVALWTVVALFGASAFAQQNFDPSAYAALADPSESIPSGTRITTANWQQYKRFLSVGLQALFSGRYFWKIPAEGVLEVGPTIKIGLPKKYREDTEKYSQSVKLVPRPDGSYTISGYTAGLPFPSLDPKDPLVGMKIVYNNYYNYIPYIVLTEAGPKDGKGWTGEDRFYSKTWSYVYEIYFKLNHLSDPGYGVVAPIREGDIFLSQNNVVWQPEQSKYVNDLLIFYDDPARDPEVYVFVPALRRSLRLSSAARCAPLLGGDYVADDSREGLNIQPPIFQAKLLGEKRVLQIAHATEGFYDYRNYYLPLSFPNPKVGKWEPRDVWVVNVQRIPSLQTGYCYGSRVVYFDKETFEPVDVDLYDASNKLWKIVLNAYQPIPLPGGDPADRVTALGGPGNLNSSLWDIQNLHLTFDIQGHSKINKEVPGQYQDVYRWGTPAGMQQVMQ